MNYVMHTIIVVYIIHTTYLDTNSRNMAGWWVQLFVALVALFSARPASTYQLDQFYSYSEPGGQVVVGSVSSAVALNTATFQFNQRAKSYISVSRVRKQCMTYSRL